MRRPPSCYSNSRNYLSAQFAYAKDRHNYSKQVQPSVCLFMEQPTSDSSSSANLVYILRQFHRMGCDRKLLEERQTDRQRQRRRGFRVIGIAIVVIGRLRPSFSIFPVACESDAFSFLSQPHRPAARQPVTEPARYINRQPAIEATSQPDEQPDSH